MDSVSDVMNNAVRLFTEAGIPGKNVCWYCNSELMGSSERALIDGAVVNMHSGCIETLSRTVNEASDAFHKEKKNYGRGFIGALIGGLIGVIPWVIVYLLGYIVGVLGLVIGFATKFGYEKIGGKPGKAKLWIIIFVVVFSVVLASVVSANIQLHNMLQDEGYTGYSLSELFDMFRMFIAEAPEYRVAIIKDTLIGLAFAFASIIGIFKEVKKEGTGNFVSIKRLSEKESV